MYQQVLHQALNGMSQPAGGPPRVGAPPNVGIGTPPAQPQQAKPGAAPGQPAQPNAPKTLQQVLHELLDNTTSKLDGHDLMDLIRAAVGNAQKTVQGAGQAIVGAGTQAANAVGGNDMMRNMIDPITGGAVKQGGP